MSMLMPSYINTRHTIIQPNDALDMDLMLVDFLGFPIDLRDAPGTKELRLTIMSLMGGWQQVAYSVDSPNYNAEMPLRIEILDDENGHVQISVDADTLDMFSGYQYTIQSKPRLGDDSEFRSLARGNIEVFNRPSGFSTR